MSAIRAPDGDHLKLSLKANLALSAATGKVLEFLGECDAIRRRVPTCLEFRALRLTPDQRL